MIKTVLGDIEDNLVGITLVHEHICCYNEYVYKMSGKDYLDKKELVNVATSYLKQLKDNYGLTTFVDCTPVNIGRDVNLLRQIAEQTEINLVCATGFYYTNEPVLYNTSAEQLCQHIIADARSVNAGIIKCAVEDEHVGQFQEKLLHACAKAHLYLGLPIVVHTNARNKNAIEVLEILFSEGVDAESITVSHLSDTDDMEFVKKIAGYGCFVGLDRLYGSLSEAYISKKVQNISELCQSGYENQIVLSHDAQFFNGFEGSPEIKVSPRFSYCFENILPQLSKELVEKIMNHNPMRLLAYK